MLGYSVYMALWGHGRPPLTHARDLSFCLAAGIGSYAILGLACALVTMLFMGCLAQVSGTGLPPTAPVAGVGKDRHQADWRHATIACLLAAGDGLSLRLVIQRVMGRTTGRQRPSSLVVDRPVCSE